jgi:serine/threonine protein kinase
MAMSPSPAEPHVVADRYRLVEPLGQGGMGRVWKARDEVLHRDVAIKEIVPPPGLTPEERQEMRERSLREARAIARLNHINVVRVFDVLRTDGDPWIVMEYVASRSLQDVLAVDGPVSQQRAAEIGLGVLEALRAAHRAGVVHRDVKPGNVLLGDDGRVVLTDFGLATVPGDPNVTRTGLVLGSPAYISPERARDGSAGPESDMWSLGATIFAAVEGQSPYARGSTFATLTALASEPPPVARNATGPLKVVLTGLLRKDPAIRMKADEAQRLLVRAAGRPQRGTSLLPGMRRRSLMPRQDGPRAAETVAAAAPDAPESKVQPGLTRLDEATPVETAPVEAAPAEAPTTTVDAPTTVVPAAPFLTPGRRLLGVALIAATALALVVAVPLTRGNHTGGNTPPKTSAAVPTGAGTPVPPSTVATASPAPTTASPTTATATTPGNTPLPTGWHAYTGSGFSIPVPEGWVMSNTSGMILFKDPGKLGRILAVSQSDVSNPDPKAALAEQEGEQSRKSGYQQLKLASVDYRNYPAADWEWLYTSDRGTPIHTLRRGFIVSGTFYTISWYVAEANWQENLGSFDVVTNGFKLRGQ